MSIFLVIAGCVVCCFVITLTATYIIDPLILYIENGLLASWIKNVSLHVKKPAWKYRYYLICPTGIPAVSYFVYGYSSKSLLLSGGIFQAIGTLKAACSIYATATKIFDKNPIREWIQFFPRIKLKFRPCPPCLAIQESCGIASLCLDIVEDNKNSSIDDRLYVISLNQKMIKETVNYLCKREERYRFLEERIDEKIKNKTYEAEINIKSQLEKIHLSDFTPTIIGLVWIAIGVILATIGSL
ncbi:hypothetical protein [Candidatus Electronema sp. JM]|uniref:hypothetical protein n=1 Tax=Candidatus Electronema sp. JM TaxID=3401571 RepID=UPI003AA99DF3